MRLIDADELLKVVDKEREYLIARGQTGAEHILVHNFRDLIDNAPTVSLQDIYQEGHYDGHLEGYTKAINEERPQGEWIPVNERLPKEGNQSYLVTVDYGNGAVCSCQRFFFNEDIGWNDDSVIAWQLLPEPYKKGDAE